MPTYDFKCLECDHEFEKGNVKMSEKDKEKCPKCGGKLKTLINTSSKVIFKGSGWSDKKYSDSNPHRKMGNI